jgi:hypothetical protein
VLEAQAKITGVAGRPLGFLALPTIGAWGGRTCVDRIDFPMWCS